MRKKYKNKQERIPFFDKMVEKYGDACMICRRYVRHLVIDHCHETDYMRGILCMNCNSGLGMFRDNIVVMNRAIDYLIEDELNRIGESLPKVHGPSDKQSSINSSLESLIADSTFKSDRARGRELSVKFGMTESAGQSQIVRYRRMHKTSLESASTQDFSGPLESTTYSS